MAQTAKQDAHCASRPQPCVSVATLGHKGTTWFGQQHMDSNYHLFSISRARSSTATADCRNLKTCPARPSQAEIEVKLRDLNARFTKNMRLADGQISGISLAWRRLLANSHDPHAASVLFKCASACFQVVFAIVCSVLMNSVLLQGIWAPVKRKPRLRIWLLHYWRLRSTARHHFTCEPGECYIDD